jgi:transcriptional antiterminator
MNEEKNSILSGASFLLKAYTLKQLSELYGVSAKTIRRWIEPITEQLGMKQGHFYNISQVKCIVTHLGVPGARQQTRA